MAELTKEQITQKLRQLKQLTEEMESLTKELMEAGALEIPEGELDHVSGGKGLSETIRDPHVSKPAVYDMAMIMDSVRMLREQLLESAHLSSLI